MSRLTPRILPLALLVFLPAAGDAQDRPAAPAEVVAVFIDGSTIRRAVLQDNVEIVTKYGKLNVPVADVRRIEFGLHVTAETTKRIDDLVGKLGSEQFAEREKAGRDLVALGAASVAALEKASRSADKEVSVGARAALERIRETVPEDRLNLKPDDVIHTRDSVITGRVATPALKARSELFGEMRFQLTHLRSIVSMARAEAQVTLDPAKFAGEPARWVDTGFHVEADTGLIITAAGKVDFSGQAVAEPDGLQAAGGVGALYARVGERDQPFYVGKRFEGKAVGGGKLYLQIISPQGAAAPSGAYKVSLLSGPDVAADARRTTADGVAPGGQGRRYSGNPPPRDGGMMGGPGMVGPGMGAAGGFPAPKPAPRR